MDATELAITEVIEGVGSKSDRFQIIDDLHIHDTKNGLKFHMYKQPEPFHITIFDTGEEIAHMRDFIKNPKHLQLFDKLKATLDDTYVSIAAQHRDKFETLFNTPVVNG